jgi:hypothetical protein
LQWRLVLSKASNMLLHWSSGVVAQHDGSTSTTLKEEISVCIQKDFFD